jgi:hypothetical protein
MTKHKASVARHASNKLRPRPFQEFICLIGAPSNTFNGWESILAKAGSDDVVSAPMPAPHTREEIRYYVRFKPIPFVGDGSNVRDLKKHGWSPEAYKRVKDKGWDPATVQGEASTTHDIYWGNFAVSASRLFILDSFDSPLRKPDPRPGDIITFVVFAPGYDQRWNVDWASSPYNIPTNVKLYIDPKDKAADFRKDPDLESSARPPRPPSSAASQSNWVPPSERDRAARDKALVQKEIEAEKIRRIPESDINYYIMMSTTSDVEDHYMRRPRMNRVNNTYRGWIMEEVGGAALGKHRDVLVKFLFISTIDQFTNYVKSGTFSGTEDEDYSFMPIRPPKKDAYNRPLKVNYKWYEHWNTSPGIKRSKIKIGRFDYFGHSSYDAIMLEYGWSNQKGEEPSGSVIVGFDHLNSAFTPDVLTADAHASLWGCFLGAYHQSDGSVIDGIGKKLTSMFRGGVCAAEDFTDFSGVLASDHDMPRPMTWVLDAGTDTYHRDKGPFTFYPFVKGTPGSK